MSSRLKSFHGPSTPTSSPVAHQRQSPASPSRQTESTFHRKTRSLLHDLRTTTETWDDLVLHGLKALKDLVDTRTDLDNTLRLLPDGRPRAHIVRPKLDYMDGCISNLDGILSKLERQFKKLNTTVDTLELLLIEAHQAKGWQWVQGVPLWRTWPLHEFVCQIASILRPYHRSLVLHIELVDKVRSHSVTFEESRNIISQWIAQPWLAEKGWNATWEDLCEAEVEGW